MADDGDEPGESFGVEDGRPQLQVGVGLELAQDLVQGESRWGYPGDAA